MTESVCEPDTQVAAGDLIRALRDKGFAVAAFSPDELRGANPDHVEDIMVERGWAAIDTLAADSGTDSEEALSAPVTDLTVVHLGCSCEK